MTTTSEKKTILFIGAQQAGKTTLMCGWYHLARQAYNATPVQEFGQTVDLLETYQRYQDVTVVDPTSRGEVTRAQFQCEHKHQKFLLELIDYAGEDLICSASKFLHGAIDESPHSELEQGFLADVTRADWIIMVHDPIAISDGTAAQLIDALWLSKVLPRILFDGQPGDVSNATLYLSRGDSISPELVANAVKSLKDCLKKNSLADLEIRCGDARVWNDTMDRKPQREFQQLFTQTMLTILDQSGSEITRIRSQATEKNSTKWWWILAIAMVLVVILGVLSQEDKSNASANAVEEIHLELDQIEDESKGNITHTKAQELLSTLESLEMRVANEVPVDSEYNEEFKEVVSVLRSVLSSIDPPRSPDSNNGIAYEIGELIKVHGPNLRAFYDDLAKTAEFAHSDDNTWDQASRKRWTQILQFCETVKDGVDIELDHSSFKGPQWWTGYIGSSYLRMEIWNTKAGDPVPFDKDSDELPPLGTTAKEPVRSIDEHSILWSGASPEASASKDLSARILMDDQIWVRFFSFDGRNGTLVYSKVPRTGPLGLDWFGTANSLSIAEQPYRVIVRIKHQLDIPPEITEAFNRSK